MILTKENPRFIEFANDLMEQTEKNECKHNFDNAINLLNEKYTEFDADETLKYFMQHGGYCDCEIIFNVIL